MRKFAGFRYLRKAETISQSEGSAVRPVKTYGKVRLLQAGTYLGDNGTHTDKYRYK
jgi:hypothetical protein